MQLSVLHVITTWGETWSEGPLCGSKADFHVVPHAYQLTVTSSLGPILAVPAD